MTDLNKRSHSEHFFQSLIENAAECIWVLDLKTKRYLYISPSVFKMRGLTVEEAMKENYEESLTSESLQKIRHFSLERLQRFMAGDRSDEIIYTISEYEQFCKDGSTILIETSTRLFLNEETNSIEIFDISREITRRKHYEKKLINKLRIQNQLLQNQNNQSIHNTSLPHVYFFGKFKVLCADKATPIKWRTSKTEELFALLLHNDSSYISKSKICNTLWPEIDSTKSSTYLHTTLYNLKTDLKAANISLHIKLNNGYYFYDLPEFYSDITDLKKLLESTFLPFDDLDEEAARSIEYAIHLYQGDYLAENGYSWAIANAVSYHKKFEKHALFLARYYFYKHDYSGTKRILSKLIELNNLNEKFHEFLLRVYIYENDFESFINHYNHLKTLLMDELNICPSDSVQNMHDHFDELVQNCNICKTDPF